jgi:multidrug efflux pump subunit AcrB
MHGWLTRQFLKRPVRAVALIVALAVLGARGVSQLSGWADWAVFSARVHMLERTGASGHKKTVDLTFRYRGEQRSVSVRVDEAYLEAARALPRSQVFGSRGWLQDAHVTTLVQVESESRFVVISRANCAVCALTSCSTPTSTWSS